MIVRCNECKTEITSSSKPQGCGCPNRLIVYDEQVSANDLSKVIMVQTHAKDQSSSLSRDDIAWQEQRRKRKVRKLNFEVR
jgi:high-affinity Fe2+/Pb2+ permease